MVEETTRLTPKSKGNPMANIRDIYRSSDTLAASDLPLGIQVPVVIEAVRAVAFDDGNKIELRFRGKKKVLMCNKTNAMRIADQQGDDYDTWPGKLIFLQRDTTEFKGQLVECVRVSQTPAAVRQASQLVQPVTSPAATGNDQHQLAHTAPVVTTTTTAPASQPVQFEQVSGDDVPF
jgi:hypothetical protein